MHLPLDWHQLLSEHLESPQFIQLQQFVAAERSQHGDAIFPAHEQTFAAFEYTPVQSLRVVVLGQDPYPTRGHAHGLAFSVQPDVRPLPASLRNIFKELCSDLNSTPPTGGSLIPWAQQGVLLLNSVLTVREGAANSHRKRGWESFTDTVIRRLSDHRDHVVFVLWGKPAQQKESLIDTDKHIVLKSAHPSPLSAHNGFFGSRPFSQINQHLRERGMKEIDWRLP